MGHLVSFGPGGGAAPVGPLLTPLDLYVASTGLDTNDGLTPLTPVLTMAGAYSKIPTRELGAPVRIHVGTYPALPWAPIPSYEQFNEQGQIIVIGDGAGQPGQNGFTTIVSSTAGAGTTNLSLDCTALAPPPNALQGATIEIAGQRRLVRDNTATAITPVAAFNPVPALNAAYSLVIPAALIDLSAGDARACEGTDALYPTIINIGVDGGGSNNSLLVDTTACLKMYGCLFTNLGYFSVRNSQVYAGLAEINSGNGRNNIHLPELWTALGGVQNWEGWGISSTGDLSQPAVIQSFTGYAVVNGLLWLSPESQFTFLGGYTGAVLAGYALLDFQFPTQLIPTLARNVASQDAIAGSFLDIRVNNSLILENPDEGGLLNLFDSVVAWTGDCTPNIRNNSNGIIWMTGGRFELVGSLNFNIPTGIGCLCANFNNGATGNIANSINVNNDGPEFVSLAVGWDSQVFVGRDMIVNSTVPQVYYGLFLADSGHVIIEGDLTLQAPLFGVASQAANLELRGNATITDAFYGWLQAYGSRGFVQGDLTISSTTGILCVGSELVTLGNTQITTTGGAVLIGGNSSAQLSTQGICTITDSLAESPAIWVGQIPQISPTVGGTSNLSLQGNVTSTGGSAIQADTGSTVIFQGNGDLTGVFDVCVITGEANLIFNRAQGEAPTNIVCANPAAGINCTGGGHCVFTFGDAPPVFAVGGPELVVGLNLALGSALPNSLGLPEQSSYAAALPNPGDSYSNAGAGASFSRRF
jgi:hypothetical protein